MKITNVLLCCFLSITAYCQSQDFDSQLEQLAAGLSKKIESKGKTKVAVWGFFTENGEKTALGNYITEDFSVYLTNFGNEFEVIDRNHLNVLLKEHQLNAEGYVDENTAKELGKIVAVDVIITGTYTVLNSVIKVRAKALDTETALQFAASMGNLALNENIASYLGISVNGSNSTNRGFNTQLSSNETVNNPETVNEMCNKNKTGDYCFANNSNEKIVVRISYYDRFDKTGSTWMKHKSFILKSKETKCLYDLVSRPLLLYAANWKDFIDENKLKGMDKLLSMTSSVKYLKDKGELKVETCKSKTYTIK